MKFFRFGLFRTVIPTPQGDRSTLSTTLLRAFCAPIGLPFLFFSLGVPLPLFAQGTAFTYQGRLQDSSGPVGGLYDMRFTMYDSASNPGTLIAGPLTNSATPVSNGLFTVTLDFGAAVFNGADRWLEIAVRTNGNGSFSTLSPRQELTPTPYAITAENVVSGGLEAGIYGNAYTFNNPANSFFGNGGGLTNVNAATLGGLGPNAFWRTTGNAGTIPGPNFLGTTDNQPLELQVNATRALRIEPHSPAAPSLVGGYFQNSVAGFYGSVIAGGGSSGSPSGVSGNYAFIGAGHGANAGNFSAVVGGAYNNSAGNFGFIAAGLSNTNLADYTFLGSGANNLIGAGSDFSLIGGGEYNFIQSTAHHATIAGGFDNRILTNSDTATIAGGHDNTIQSAPYSVIGGGGLNKILPGAYDAVIGGGGYNTIQTNSVGATVSGGDFNTVDTNSPYGTIGGGYANTIQPNSPRATIGGGVNNLIETNADIATIVGGHDNTIQGAPFSVIGGGGLNMILPGAYDAVISGGGYNQIQTNSVGSAIGGGDGNIVDTNSPYGTIAGGYGNTIQPNSPYSVVAGGVFNQIQTNSYDSAIGGGADNTIEANAAFSTIAGGAANTIETNSFSATIGGGYNNRIQTNASYSTIAGGGANTIQTNAYYSSIAGGFYNTIQTNAFFSTIGGGYYNIIQTNAACAVVPGGSNNLAAANYSFAAGQQAQALHTGSFVWADSQNAPFASTLNDQFNVRAQGGVRFVTGGAGLSVDGEPAALLNAGQTFSGANVFNNPGNSFTGDGTGLTNVNAAAIGGLSATNLWQLGGNSGNPNTVLGTLDSGQPLNIIAGGVRVLQVNRASRVIGFFDGVSDSANLMAGPDVNVVWGGVLGGTIAGGGKEDFFLGDPLHPVPYPNTVSDDFCTIGGGLDNLAGNTNADVTDVQAATVAGGANNQATSSYAVVSGGLANQASGFGSVVGGGGYDGVLTAGNVASAASTVVSGGIENSAENNYASVGGGAGNANHGYAATLGGGWFNYIGGASYGTLAGGRSNNVAGLYAMIPGGFNNLAGGTYSLAAGQQAKALHQGAFVWADSQNAAFTSSANDQFLIRAAGGVGVNKNNPTSTLDVNGTTRIQGINNWDVSNTEGDFRVGNDSYRFKIGVANAGGGAGDVWMRAHGGTGRVFLKTPGGTTIYSNEGQTTGVSLAAGGGAWASLSDRNSKENFRAVDPEQILHRVVSLPLTTWNYKSQEKSVRHIGPMAQDFAAAFHVGEDNKHITTIDADGVALAAIQGLNQKLVEKDAEIRQLKQQNESLERRMSELEQMFKQALVRK